MSSAIVRAGTASKIHSAFDPRSIPGCQLWLDASDRTTFTLSGSTLATIRDKSGTGKTITIGSAPTYSATGFNTSYPTFTFTTSNFLTTTLTTAIGTGDCMFVAVMRNTGTAAQNNVLSAGVSGLSNEMAMGWNNAESRYKFFQFGTGEGNDNTIANNVNLIMIGTRISSTMSIFLNGKNPVNTGTATTNNTNTTIYVGMNTNFTFAGQISEILLYVGTTTTAQRRQLEGYLSKKWGITLSTSALGHPYRNTVPFTRPFYPNDISSCCLWLDAADRSSFTLSGSNVATITDKSGAGSAPTVNGTVAWSATGLNNLPTFVTGTTGPGGSGHFRGALSTTVPITRYTHTTFIVTSLTSTTTAGFPAMSFYESATGSSVFYRPLDYNPTNFRTVAFFASVVLTTIAGQLGSPFIWVESYNGAANGNAISTFYNYNATLTTATSATVNAPTTNPTHFGVGSDGAPVAYNSSTWPGNISEVIVYNSVLTTPQRQLVEGYLAHKWKLTGVIPATHPFKLYPSLTTSFNPLSLSDIGLWLDAYDPSANGTLPASGTAISTWTDKSANGRNATQATVGNRPTFLYDGIYPSIYFSRASSQYLNGSSLLTSTNYGIFVACRSNTSGIVSGNNDTVFFDRKVTTANAENYVRMTVLGRTGLSVYRNAQVYYNNNSTTPTWKNYSIASPSLATSRIIMEIVDNSSLSNSSVFYENGTLQSGAVVNNGAGNVNTDAEGYKIGATNITGTLSNYLEGFIYEVIVILHLPTPYERQAIEAYLAWKWGLRSSLPSSHPYYKFMP